MAAVGQHPISVLYREPQFNSVVRAYSQRRNRTEQRQRGLPATATSSLPSALSLSPSLSHAPSGPTRRQYAPPSTAATLKSSCKMAPDFGFHAEDADIATVLFSASAIHEKVAELGEEISRDFVGRKVAVLGVATGAFMFLADLVRAISIPLEVDFIRAVSYGHGTESSGNVQLSGDLKINVEGMHVIVVEDILDTGRTLSALVKHLEAKKAASVSVCVLLDKPERRVIPVTLSDGGKLYTGFQCPDQFVVGYGLDFAEKYRSLSYVGVLRPELYMT